MAKGLLSREEEVLLMDIDKEKKKITKMYKRLLSDYMTKEGDTEVENGSTESDT